MNDRDRIYHIKLTEEEVLALPILKELVTTYMYNLYDKKEGDEYFNKHLSNMKLIADYQKNHQGICAVMCNIADKVNAVFVTNNSFAIKEAFDLFNQLLSCLDFGLTYNGECFQFVDWQGANLGGIESDEFDDIPSMIDRLKIYINDVIINDIKELLPEAKEANYHTYQELLKILKSLDKERQDIVARDTKFLKMIVEAPDYDFFYDKDMLLKYLVYDKE